MIVGGAAVDIPIYQFKPSLQLGATNSRCWPRNVNEKIHFRRCVFTRQGEYISAIRDTAAAKSAIKVFAPASLHVIGRRLTIRVDLQQNGDSAVRPIHGPNGFFE